MNVKESMVDAIGNTPLIKLNRLMKEYGVEGNVYAKLERSNPTGSIKDRAAKEMLLDAMERGEVDKDTVIVEPTSGNTGIGLAACCASLGLRCVIFMPSNASQERVKIMKALGAEIIVTDVTKGGMKFAIQEAKAYVSKLPKAFMPMQFSNPDNALAHYKTTGPEIYKDLDGKVDVFCAGFGSAGTITGVGRYLKEQNKDILIVGVEPKGSPVITEGHGGSHKIQGIGAGFRPDVLKSEYVDRFVTVSDEDSYRLTRELARFEGLFVGISSGCNVFEALQLAKEFPHKNIVTVLPDNGERYLSVDGLF